MALPASSAGRSSDVRQFQLSKECELRCEAQWDAPLTVRLVEGTAEVFGTELPIGQPLTFRPGDKFAVFTWDGATLELEGKPEVVYTADETPMVSYANVHAVLEQRRQAAREAGVAGAGAGAAAGGEGEGEGERKPKQGPRVVLVGPTDSGKSSLSRILLSYAARMAWAPLFVDLDIGQGSLGIPGTIGATPVERPVDPVDGLPSDAPILYFFGHASPTVNADLYRHQVESLAALINVYAAGSVEARAAGVLINTMGWVEGLGLELLLHAIDALKADVVLVLGEERLYSVLSEMLKGRGRSIDIVKLARSGGVVTRSRDYRAKARALRTRAYFYGLHAELSPHVATVPFSELRVFRLGGSNIRAPRSVLPVGAEPTSDPLRAEPVTFGQELMHAVLGVSYAAEPEQLTDSNCAGFIYITDVDMAQKRVSYMAPSPGPLPGNILLVGTLTWVDNQ